MIASHLRLSRADIKALKVTDSYSLHRVVYGLFEDVRSVADKEASLTSGILYVDKGGDFNGRNILMLSNRAPNVPLHGELQSRTIPAAFLQHDNYRFEVVINPTKRDKASGKIVPVKGREAIAQWFIEKAPKAWGFQVNAESLQINSIAVLNFDKKGQSVTLASAHIQGDIIITDREQFIKSFQHGLGRGRSFGLGLLQVVPRTNPFSF